MNAAAMRLGALVALAVAPACVLDLAQKHGCRVDSDCVAGHVCVAFVCQARAEAGVPLVVGTDAGGEPDDVRDMREAAAEVAPDAGAQVDADADADAAADPDAASDSGDAGTSAERPPMYVSSGTPNYMFVTSETFVPIFSSLEVADQKCDDAAQAAGLPGNYHAFLSTSAVDARDRIADARGWIRPDGAPFADRVADIARGWVISPPLIDERGHELASGTAQWVATGTGGNGLLQGDACADWSGGGSGQVYAGNPWGTSEYWTTQTIQYCSTPLHLYCFGIDHVSPVTIRPAEGKRAFLSDGAFANRIGVEGADQLCASEAFMAGLPGTFLALLATTSASAASRFPAGVPHDWVRIDGMPLNRPGEDLLAGGRLAVPLNVTSRGIHLATYVLTGIASSIDEPAASTADTCADWTVSLDVAQTVKGINGEASILTEWLRIPDFAGPCDVVESHVYCLEQ
jgi:hypothetical protein